VKITPGAWLLFWVQNGQVANKNIDPIVQFQELLESLIESP
jgi:hypothetical protein